MAQIAPVLIVTDEPAGVPQPGVTPADPVTRTFVGVDKLSVTWQLSAPEDMSYKAGGANVSILTPGVPPAGTRIIGFSLDNGAHVDARMLSGGTQVNADLPITISESGKSIGAALATTHIARSSAQQISIDDAFNGVRGTVKMQAPPGKTRIITPGGIIPYYEGASKKKVGLPGSSQAAAFAFTWVVDPAIAHLPLDVDVNRDTLDRVTLTIAQHLGSAVDPQQAQFVIDSGDYGMDHTRPVARTVTVGHLGTVSQCTFQDFDTPTTPQPILVGEGLQASPQTLQMLASVSLLGGDTHHGLPPSGKMTDIVTLNQMDTDATGNYRSGIPVVSFYGDRDHGGVYFWPGDGLFHPMSQAMGVNGLWYDETGANLGGQPVLYAATDAGVYNQVADPAVGTVGPWPRLGNMALKCLKVISINAVYALVEIPATGMRHILRYDITSPTGYGFDGWMSVYSNSGMFDFAIQDGLDVLQKPITIIVALSTETPGYYHVAMVHHEDPVHPPKPDQTLPIPGGATGPVGIGLDMVVSFAANKVGTIDVRQTIYLRTDSGSESLFMFPVPAGYVNGVLITTPVMEVSFSSAGYGLRDANSDPVKVNAISAHSAGVVRWDGLPSVPVRFLAATSAGLFVSADGSNWQATDGQNNLGTIDIRKAAGAPPRSWAVDAPIPPATTPVKRLLTRFYAIGDRSLYISHDGTVSWVDALQLPLDEGPAFFDYWAGLHSGLFPDNNATTVDLAAAGVGTGLLVRQLNDLSHPTYLTINQFSGAPAGAHRDAELSQISASAYVPEVPLSKLLVSGAGRLLAYTADAQTIIEMVSMFDDDANELRFLRPTQLVHVNGSFSQQIDGLSPTPIPIVTFSNQPFYVLMHRIEFDAVRGDCLTYTRLATICVDDRTDSAKVNSDLFYQISRDQLYKSKGRH